MQGVPPVPPSIIASQGQQASQQQDQSLQQQTMQMATQKLLEYKNVLEGLLTVMKAVDPESVALFMPAIEFGQALEARLAQVNKRAATPQPSMGGMVGGQSPPTGAMGGAGQSQDSGDPSGGTAAGM
jgi:hypothetical protein